MATNETKAEPKKPTTEEPVFEKSEIIESASLFGTTPEIMAGALTLVNKDTITRQEAKNALKAFLVKPVGKE